MLTVSPLPSEAGWGYEENEPVQRLTAGWSLKSIRADISFNEWVAAAAAA